MLTNEFLNFLEEPYCLIQHPSMKNAFLVIVPKFVRFNLGWLEHETKSYRIFVLNKYMVWLVDLPPSLREKIDFEEPLPVQVDGKILQTNSGFIDEVWRRYKDFLSQKISDDAIRIKRGREFDLIVKLIEDGILPFTPTPVDEDDLREFKKIRLRDYQEKAWKKFIETGATGVFWSFGSGKSFFGLYALARIKGQKLVVVPTITLKEQWKERIWKYIPEYVPEIEIVTYRVWDKLKDKKYNLVIYDECHRLPAPTYITLSTLRTKYRIGLSGSPFREDGRESYIFALSGFPVGLDWRDLIDRRIVKPPTFKVCIVENRNKKIDKVKELLTIPVKTIIFCDSIYFGEKLSERLNIPFVHGETKNRLEIIKNNQFCILSRVGDEGISIPEIERVIEVDFLKGSRMQESQRYGRLMHSLKDGCQHIILMTNDEYERYSKRLYSIIERGFPIEYEVA